MKLFTQTNEVRMNHTGRIRIFCAILALLATALVIQPVAAANSSISIGYSGSGGSYIGDMIFFSGKFSGGDTVQLRISGPGLPPGGVPVNNLDAQPGTGTPIEVGPGGTWKFLWYSASAQGAGKLQTARYTFTIQDSSHPDVFSTTSIILKKPEFSASVSPDPSLNAEYVEITGVAEESTSSVRIDVSDSNGTVYHTFIAPVGSDGSFSFGFHVDMRPGRYTVVVSYPSMHSTLTVPMTVVSSRPSGNQTTGAAVNTSLPGQAVTGNPAQLPGTGSVTGVPTPSRAFPLAPLPPLTAVLALAILGGCIVLFSLRKSG